MRGAAARNFGRGQEGEFGASPPRAVSTKPTQITGKGAAARLVRRSRSEGGRVFAKKDILLCCSSVEDPRGIFSGARAEALAPRHSAFCAKAALLVVFQQAPIHANLQKTYLPSLSGACAHPRLLRKLQHELGAFHSFVECQCQHLPSCHNSAAKSGTKSGIKSSSECHHSCKSL
jgi:hypothetical protein